MMSKISETNPKNEQAKSILSKDFGSDDTLGSLSLMSTPKIAPKASCFDGKASHFQSIGKRPPSFVDLLLNHNKNTNLESQRDFESDSSEDEDNCSMEEYSTEKDPE